MKNVIKRGDLLLFKANYEDIDLESIKRYRYPLIDGKNWKLREIKDEYEEDIENLEKKEKAILTKLKNYYMRIIN